MLAISFEFLGIFGASNRSAELAAH